MYSPTWEGHKSGILVSPIFIIRDSCRYDLTHKWEANCVTNSWNDLVNAALSEVDIVLTVHLILLSIFKSLLGPHPVFWDIIIDVNHKLKDGLDKVLQEVFILLGNWWNSLNYGDKEFNWKLSDLLVSKIIFQNNWANCGEDILKLRLEEFRFNFCNLVEFDEGVFEDNFIIFFCSISDHLEHAWYELNKLFCIFLFNSFQVAWNCTKSRQFNIKRLMTQSLHENTFEFILVLV